MSNPSRRERLRAAARDEIKQTARAYMQRHGAANLSLRAVAAEIGMSPAALYYYYPNRDALITELIVDAYRALGAALHTAQTSAREVATQLAAVMFAYRDWAKANRADYELIFGTPIPDYHAPREITVPVARDAIAPFTAICAEALAQSRLRRSHAAIPAHVQAEVEMWRRESGDQTPLFAQRGGLRAWSLAHGLVSLELFGHLRAVEGVAAELYAFEVNIMLEELFTA